MNKYWENSTLDYSTEGTNENNSTNENDRWNIDRLGNSEFTIDELINFLVVIDKFKRKYPNDDIPVNMEDVVREEICNIFGGTTLED